MKTPAISSVKRLLVAAIAACLCSLAGTAHAAGSYLKIDYPASADTNELQTPVTYTLWLPDNVSRFRGVIVHQHGAGTNAAYQGESAAYDLQWQALAAKWDCALLGPSYHVANDKVDLSPGGAEFWFDPRHGSEKAFLKCLADFAKQSGHPEIETVPWALWGHSGGGIWSDVMACLHPDRVVVMWLRSGTASMFRTKPEFPQPKVPAAIYEIPIMCNAGIKEMNNGPWIGSISTFQEFRLNGAPIGFAPDPRTGHECGDSRYLAIPYIDACLALRLPDKGSSSQKLKKVDMSQTYLAALMSQTAEPAAAFKGNPAAAVWLPNKNIARIWSEYVKSNGPACNITDATPPPPPHNVIMTPKGDEGTQLTWDAEADLESGIRCFIVVRDGQKIAPVPETPVGQYGRPLFQTMTYGDTPKQPLPKMEYLDTSAKAGEKHTYTILTVNSVELNSEPSAPAAAEGQSKPPAAAMAPAGANAPGTMVVWYRQPGKAWMDASPLGNGMTAAMVFGRVQNERIALNDSSFWSGRPHDYDNPEALTYFPQIKELVFAGKYQEAERMADRHFFGVPAAQQAYQTVGDLLLDFDGVDTVTEYRRELNMETGVSKVTFRSGDTAFTRETFISHPDKVMVVRLTADKPGRISLHARLKEPYPGKTIAQPGKLTRDGAWSGSTRRQDGLIAQVAGAGESFEVSLVARAEHGQSTADEDSLNIQQADAVTLLLTTATSYINYQDISGDPAAICKKTLAACEGRDYATLRRRHEADFSALMGRVHLSVGDASLNDKPIEERLAAAKAGAPDANLEALVFQLGRYILASSSRAGGQPANLQGIWNESTAPSWGSKYTININTEMNYWPAEICNLSECDQPLFSMIKDISVTGAKTARVQYGITNGWVTHHNIDLWRGTAPVDAAKFGMWPMGGAWLLQQVWEHYAYSGDQKFLKEYYPVMKGSAEFFLNLMVEEPKHHWLVTPFSMSPEHAFVYDDNKQGYLSPAPTMDVGILRELFPHCIAASKILGVDAPFRAKLEDALAKLPPYRIGKSGFVQEWIEDWPSGNGGHNVSPNFPFYPGSSVTLRGNPDLAAAYQRWMEAHNPGGGFLISWGAAMWARLERGDKVQDCLETFMKKAPALNLHNAGSNQSDASFGFTAAVAEALLQSHAGEISLLPAIPTNWPDGSVSGLRARGGYEVGMKWQGGKLVSADITNAKGGPIKLRSGAKTASLTLKSGATLHLNAELAAVK